MHPQAITLSKTWRSRNENINWKDMADNKNWRYQNTTKSTCTHLQKHCFCETFLCLSGQPNLNREASNSSRRVWAHRKSHFKLTWRTHRYSSFLRHYTILASKYLCFEGITLLWFQLFIKRQGLRSQSWKDRQAEKHLM